MREWRCKMRKYFKQQPAMKIVAIMTVVVLLLTLIPLLRLAMYAAPWYDDYTYGTFVKTYYELNPSIAGIFSGVWECVRIQWHAWQGTFSSIFFMSLMPGIWGEQWYFIGPMFLILILTVSTLTLVGVFLRRVLQAERTVTIVLQTSVTIMVVMFIHTAQAGFYWYNGGVHYVGMHSFFMLMIASAICLVTSQKRGESLAFLFITLVLAIVCSGANYVTALQGLLMLLSMIAWCILIKNKRGVLLIPITIAYIIGFCLNVVAPGNDKRRYALERSESDPVSAIVNSFVEAVANLWDFTGIQTLIFVVLLAPFIYYVVVRTKIKFRYPLLVLVWSFCFYATGFTPSLFSLGHAGMSRTLNAVKITYQILLILNEIYLIGWYVQKKREKGETLRKGTPVWCFYPMIVIAFLVIFGLEDNQAGNYSSYGAYYYVHTGEAYNFYQEYLQRLELLKSDEKNVIFEPYCFKPWFLRPSDLSDNPEEESNRALASWYDKESIVVQYD